MIKKLAWESFKKTGDINTYLEFKKFQEAENNIKEYANENSKGKWDNNSRT